MKQQINNQTKAISQKVKDDHYAFSATFRTDIFTRSFEKLRRNSNTLMIQNIGKDPPGRARSPVSAYCLNPDNRPVSLQSNKTLFNIDAQIFKQRQNPDFLTINF